MGSCSIIQLFSRPKVSNSCIPHQLVLLIFDSKTRVFLFSNENNAFGTISQQFAVAMHEQISSHHWTCAHENERVRFPDPPALDGARHAPEHSHFLCCVQRASPACFPLQLGCGTRVRHRNSRVSVRARARTNKRTQSKHFLHCKPRSLVAVVMVSVPRGNCPCSWGASCKMSSFRGARSSTNEHAHSNPTRAIHSSVFRVQHA